MEKSKNGRNRIFRQSWSNHRPNHHNSLKQCYTVVLPTPFNNHLPLHHFHISFIFLFIFVLYLRGNTSDRHDNRYHGYIYVLSCVRIVSSLF